MVSSRYKVRSAEVPTLTLERQIQRIRFHNCSDLYKHTLSALIIEILSGSENENLVWSRLVCRFSKASVLKLCNGYWHLAGRCRKFVTFQDHLDIVDTTWA